MGQRRYRRMTVRIEVSYLDPIQGSVASALATTLGAGGLFIRTDAPLRAGDPLRVRFKLPGGGRSHELDAEVVWVNGAAMARVPASGRGMGVAFRDGHAQQRLARDLEASEADAEGSG